VRKVPRIHPSVFVAPGAVLIGDVTVEEEASIWFGCVLRAEEAPIHIGPRTNIQDLTVIHTDVDRPCRVGAGVTVGHRAVLHGAVVEDGALIGIGGGCGAGGRGHPTPHAGAGHPGPGGAGTAGRGTGSAAEGCGLVRSESAGLSGGPGCPMSLARCQPHSSPRSG